MIAWYERIRFPVLIHGILALAAADSISPVSAETSIASKVPTSCGTPSSVTLKSSARRPSTPTTCVIHWSTGGTESEGICSRNDNAFAAAYVLGDAMGLVVYKVMADGSLDGLWTIAGKEGIGTEVLTPAK